jgi:hypothetical protein
VKELFECIKEGQNRDSDKINSVKQSLQKAVASKDINTIADSMQKIYDTKGPKCFAIFAAIAPIYSEIITKFPPNTLKSSLEEEFEDKTLEQKHCLNVFLNQLNGMFVLMCTNTYQCSNFKNLVARHKGEPETHLPATQEKILTMCTMDLYDAETHVLFAWEPDYLKWAGAHWPAKKRWDIIFMKIASKPFLELHPELVAMGISTSDSF